MMSRFTLPASSATPRGIILGATVLLWVAATIAAFSAWRAIRLDGAAGGPALTAPTPRPATLASRHEPSWRAPVPALDNDPFSADRRLPLAPVRKPSPPPDTATRELPPAAVRLLGTVVRPAGTSFVVYQLPSEVPGTLRVGEQVAGLTLVEIAPGRATFRTRTGALVPVYLIRAGS